MHSSKKKSGGSNRRQNVCSKCQRPARGHVGPQGKYCGMMPETSPEHEPSKLVQPNFDTVSQDSGRDKDAILMELTNQIGKMALSMQQVQQDVTTLKTANVQEPTRLPVSRSQDTSADSKASGDTYECLASGAKVTTKVLKAARTGECVNLIDFAPVLEPSNTTETTLVDGELVFKAKRAVRSIDSFLLWSLAWRGYEEHLVDGNPRLYKVLSDYRTFIQTSAAKYWWQAVYAYDVRNRSRHSMTRSFNFNRIDTDIYVSCMDPGSMRTNIKQCSRCKSIWHVTRDCPFPSAHEVETSTRQTPSTPSPRTDTKGRGHPRKFNQQICFAWNSGRCYGPECERLHVCQGCGGSDPIFRCRSCNSQSKHMSASASSFTPGGSTQGSGHQPPQGRVAP